MCRIDERVYVRTDGHESVFNETVMCEKGRRRGKTCSDAKVRRTKYTDPSSSPLASSPLTPTYNTRTRRPSTSSRPSTRDGPISSLKPEIHIEIGSKKSKGKSYIPTISITTGKSKRSSTSSTSAYESPGSETSHTVRTGFPDVSPPPLNSSHGGLRPRTGQYRNLSSEESISGSSRVPSLYQTSDDYDTPSLNTTTTSTSSGTRPIVHNGTRPVPPSINTTRGQTGSPASPYRTTEFRPRGPLNDTFDRPERDQRQASSYAPEITGRDEDRQRRREEQKRRQEALDREIASNLIREENNKHVRFNIDRTKRQPEERAQNSFGAHEQRRGDRQQKKEREEQAAKKAAAEEAAKRSKTSAPTKPSRRGSIQMTAAQAAEQHHLVAAEAYQMQQERIKAEALEREEQSQQQAPVQQRQPISLQERQQDPSYYDPRGVRTTQPRSQAPVVCRPSQTGQIRPDLGRRNSTRDSAVPQIRQDRRQPPLAFYNNANARPDLPPARERRQSSSHGANPFAQPGQAADPWDMRNVNQALPNARGPQVGHNFPQPQHATHRLNQAFYKGEYETDSEDDLYSSGR